MVSANWCTRKENYECSIEVKIRRDLENQKQEIKVELEI